MSSKKILTVTTGGTIFQKAINGKMEIALSAVELIEQTEFTGQVDFFETDKRSGSEMTFETLISLRDKLISSSDDYDGIVLITGTDSMEEIAFSLDLLVDIEIPIVITGSIKPSDIIGYDGIANYSDALKIAANAESKNKGVLLFLNDTIHLARYVREVRCGKVIYYYDITKKSETYKSLDLDKLYSLKIPIWTMAISPYFPREMLPNIDGLVIAGMGTGSLASDLMNELGAQWTDKLPIILSSRCHVGLSYDDHCYKGSKDKYESKGFIIEDYASLNPLQARIRLSLELSKR
jgi:L-asparaginase